MGQYQGLTYTTAYPMAKGDVHVPKGRRMNARSGMTNLISDGAFAISTHVGMQKQIKPLLPKIKKYIAAGQTVLVVSQFRERMGLEVLHYTFIAAVSGNRKCAFDIHLNKQTQPILRPGPPDGWVMGKEVYHWFEDEKTAKERNKAEKPNLYWKSVTK